MIDESLQEGFIPLHIAAYNTITNINENNEKIINNEHEISKLIKALPKDIAALDKRFDKLLKVRNHNNTIANTRKQN